MVELGSDCSGRGRIHKPTHMVKGGVWKHANYQNTHLPNTTPTQKQFEIVSIKEKTDMPATWCGFQQMVPWLYYLIGKSSICESSRMSE